MSPMCPEHQIDGIPTPAAGCVPCARFWEGDAFEYVGGQSYPADLWGRAPIRGKAVKVVEDFVTRCSVLRVQWTAGELVDELIKHDLLPNETR